MARGDRRPGGRRRPRRPRRPRRVGPSVPDIAPRPRDHRGFAAARPEFFVWLFSGGNSRPGKSGVHYTQLDARVAPRYVRQTALLLTSPYYIASHRFPSRFSLRRFGTLRGSPRARFPLGNSYRTIPLYYDTLWGHVLRDRLHAQILVFLSSWISYCQRYNVGLSLQNRYYFKPAG